MLYFIIAVIVIIFLISFWVAREEGKRLDYFKTQYGELTKTISYEEKDSIFSSYIYVFEPSSIIIIKNIPFQFERIIDFEVFDNSQVVYSGQEIKTRTNTGSLIGRTIAGRIVYGKTGAIIGGSSASKTTKISGKTVSQKHDYTINIITDDISDALISIHLGEKYKELTEIKAVLINVLKRNSLRIEDTKNIRLTIEIIEAARTPRGGFTKSQLAAIGIGWPAPKDWISQKVGTMISSAQLEQFMNPVYISYNEKPKYAKDERKELHD